MDHYFLWLTNGNILAVPALPIFLAYLAIAILFLIFKWSILLGYFLEPILEESIRLDKLHGRRKEPLIAKIFWICMGIGFAPCFEEIVFRGPVLWFFLTGGVGAGAVSMVLCSLLFALVHRTNTHRYADGTRIPTPWLVLPVHIVGGILCGILTMLTGSLWPGILLHTFYNATVFLLENLTEEDEMLAFCKSLQR